MNLMIVSYNVNVNFSWKIFRYCMVQIFTGKHQQIFNSLSVFYSSKFSILLSLMIFLLVATQVGSIWSNIEMSQLPVIATSSSSLFLDIIVTLICITTNTALNNRVNSEWVLHNVRGSWSMYLVSHILPSVLIVQYNCACSIAWHGVWEIALQALTDVLIVTCTHAWLLTENTSCFSY